MAVDTGISAFPHYAQLNQCTRIYCSAQKGNEPEVAVRLHGTSHEFGSKTATQLATMIRELWRVEILHPWKRDASSWQKEQAPKRNPRGAQNLAPIRDALLAVIPFADEGFESLNDAFDYYRDHRENSVKLIVTTSPVPPQASQANAPIPRFFSNLPAFPLGSGLANLPSVIIFRDSRSA